MPISATCPGCGKIISAPDSAAGHKAKCPHCGEVVTFRADPAAALAAAVAAEGAAAPTPAPARAGGPSKQSSTTVSRMLARTSPYDALRLLAAIIFGVGIAVSVLVFLGGLGALILLATTRDNPWIAVGAFAGALILALMLFLGAKMASELARLWADVGDRTRHVAQMLEESLNQPRDNSR